MRHTIPVSRQRHPVCADVLSGDDILEIWKYGIITLLDELRESIAERAGIWD